MLLNATAQHRAKHFDLLLSRELILLQREHEQNLITHKKLEKSIVRESNQILKSNQKKFSIPLPEISDYYKTYINTNNILNEKRRLSISNNNINQNEINETTHQISPKYRRFCLKPQRLPPIVKPNISNRLKESNTDLYRMTNFEQSNLEKENLNETLTILNEELSQTPLKELTPMQKQIHSFMETLPIYEGVQGGFDNFAPSSLYSNRAPVAMR